MPLITLGTLALDTIKTPSGEKSDILGGSAAHFSMSSRFFVPTSLVANIGEDFPRRHLDFLRNKKIDLRSVRKEKGKSFRWKGEYKKGALNTAITLKTELGVLSSFSPQVDSVQKKIKHVFLANVDPNIQTEFLKNFGSAKLVGLDSMNYWIQNTRRALLRLLKMVDIFVANDAEARLLSEENNLIRAARKLNKSGPPIIVIKKGEHGAILLFNNLIFTLPAYPIENIIDPTGAGDTFAGGFMGYLATQHKINNSTLKRAVAYGTIFASFNVEAFGLNRMARLTWKDIQERRNIFRKSISF